MWVGWRQKHENVKFWYDLPHEVKYKRLKEVPPLAYGTFLCERKNRRKSLKKTLAWGGGGSQSRGSSAFAGSGARVRKGEVGRVGKPVNEGALK